MIGIFEGRTRHPVFDGRPGSQKNIILVAAHHIGALGAQHADHPEGNVFDPNLLADCRLSLKQLPCQRLSQHADLGGRNDVALAEHFAFSQIGPLADLQKRRRGAIYGRGDPVAAAVDHLGAGTHHRCRAAKGRTLAPYCFAILGGKGGGRAGPEADASAGCRAGPDHQDIGAHAGNGFLQGRR